NRDGHNNTYQSNNSNVASHRFAQMKVSDGHQGYSRGGNNYRNDGNRGSRGRGGSSGGRGRGKPFNANYSNPYQQQQQFQQRPQQYQQQQPQFQPQQFPPLSAAAPRPNIFPPPAAAAGYVPPMSQHIRNPNATGIAPFSDNNVRKTYYNNSRKR
uniref:La protein n=1 Tax=Panagrolaimus sp. ES5 TaxID=591445 RepID=A0AC34FXS1_9BILA